MVYFLDDIVILGRSFEDHMKNMEQVLSRFRDFKLKLKSSKCELLKRDIIFLGHKVSREGVSPNPGKVREAQLEDDIVGKVLRWLELGGEPQREELYWRIQPLNIFGGSGRI